MRPAWRRTVAAVASVAGAFLLSCSDAKDPALATSNPGDDVSLANAMRDAKLLNAPPVIQSVRLSPQEVKPGELLTAKVEVQDPEGQEVELGYTWRLGAHRLPGGESTMVVPRTAKRGDLLSVSVVASDAESTSGPVQATSEVANSAPEWRELSMEHRERVVPGSKLTISAVADDHDGDELTFDIRWYINNRLARFEGSVFDTRDLKRGDEIFAVVLAADKTNETPERETDTIVIHNAEPTIVSAPGQLSTDGSFSYQVEMEDPDGDRRFRFALASGPPRMKINSSFGEVTWRATEEDKGTHRVEIVATDLYGGEARQQFELTVSVRSEESSPAALAEEDSL